MLTIWLTFGVQCTVNHSEAGVPAPSQTLRGPEAPDWPCPERTPRAGLVQQTRAENPNVLLRVNLHWAAGHLRGARPQRQSMGLRQGQPRSHAGPPQGKTEGGCERHIWETHLVFVANFWLHWWLSVQGSINCIFNKKKKTRTRCCLKYCAMHHLLTRFVFYCIIITVLLWSFLRPTEVLFHTLRSACPRLWRTPLRSRAWNWLM